MDKNKLYPNVEDQNLLNLNDLDAIDEQDQEDLDDLDKQEVATDNQDIYNARTPNLNKAKTPALIDQIFGTPVAAAEKPFNIEDYLTSGPVKPETYQAKEPKEVETPSTDIPKKEKPAVDSDQTAYDMMSGIPIGTLSDNYYEKIQNESTWAAKVHERNLFPSSVLEKLFTGEELSDEDKKNATYTDSIVGGIINNAIKIPFTFNYIAAAIVDFLNDEDIPVDEGEVAKLTKQIQSLPLVGKLAKSSSELEEQTLAGEIAGFITSIYGANKFVKAMQVGNSITGYAATGRLMLGGGENVVRAAEVANELNKMSRASRFVAIAAGDAADGFLTNALIADVSGLATFGNIFGGPTAADMDKKKYAKDEADRLLINRLKFGIEGAIVPIVFAFGKSSPYAEAAKQTQNLIKNDSELETFLDKVGPKEVTLETYAPATLYAGIPFDEMVQLAKAVGRPVNDFLKDLIKGAKEKSQSVGEYVKEEILPMLRNRGKITQELADKLSETKFEETAVRKIDASQAKNDMNISLSKIFEDRSLLQSEVAPKIVNAADELLHSGENKVVKIIQNSEGETFKTTEGIIDIGPNGKKVVIDYEGNIVGDLIGKEVEFGGFGKGLSDFFNKLKDYGIEDVKIQKLIDNITEARNSMNAFFNKSVNPDIMEEAIKEFNKIMKARTNPFLNSEYAIFNNKSTVYGYSYKPSEESINELRKILIDNAKSFGVELTESDLNAMLNNIAEASLNSKTLTPEFTIRNIDKLSGGPDKLTINLRNSINAEGEFVSNAIIQTKEQLEAFQKYFGQVKNLGGSVYSLINDAGIYASRTKVFSDIRNINNQLIKEGKNGLFFEGAWEDAEKYFTERGIKSKDLVEYKPDSKYLNPFQGPIYTTKEIAEALSLSEKIPFQSIFQNGFYRTTVLPFQSYLSAKNTVLSAPREILNGIQYFIMTVGNGNVFKDFGNIWNNFSRNFGQSYGAARVGLGESFAAKSTKEARDLYRYMISKNIGMTHLNFSNLEEILKDSATMNKIITGEIQPIYKTVGGVLQKSYQLSKNFYMSVDNFGKFFNTLSEYDSLVTAYKNAIKEGLEVNGKVIKEMPSAIELMDMATKKVQDIMPNYAKVPELVRMISKFPLLGNYVLWPSEMIRNVYSAYRLGLQEYSNPITKGIGARRLISMTTSLGVMGGALTSVWNPIVGFGEEKLGALRRYVSRYSTYSNLMAVPEDQYGRPGYIDFDHFNPWSNVTAPFTAIVASLNEGKFKDQENYLLKSSILGAWEAIVKATESYRQEKLGLKPLTDLFYGNGRTAEGKEIWSPNDDGNEKFIKGLGYLMHEFFLPPYEYGTRLRKAFTNQPDDNGQRYNKLDEVLGLLGLRIRRIDPTQGFDFKMGKFNAVNHTINFDIAKFNRDYSDLENEDAFTKELYKQSERKYNAMSELAADYKAAQILGADSDDIRENHKSNKKLLNFLEDNEFLPIKSFMKQVKKGLSDKEKQLDKYYNGESFELPENQDIADTVSDMTQDMTGVPLGKKLSDFININNYLKKPGLLNKIFNKPAVAPLPIQPGPNAQIIPQTIGVGNQTGVGSYNNLNEAEKAKALFT